MAALPPIDNLHGKTANFLIAMRKQYHFRPPTQGLLAWDVDRLIKLSAGLPHIKVPLTQIRELDEVYWFSAGECLPTCRAVIEHARLINEADLRYPIILSADGGVMDGTHRVAKAVLQGWQTIVAVQFQSDPEPDYVGVSPHDLSYDETEPLSPGEC